jgi:hypothetical protein
LLDTLEAVKTDGDRRTRSQVRVARPDKASLKSSRAERTAPSIRAVSLRMRLVPHQATLALLCRG